MGNEAFKGTLASYVTVLKQFCTTIKNAIIECARTYLNLYALLCAP